MRELSIIIPSRNEMFLARTIEDILANSEADTEIIAVLDGAWANPPVPDNDRVTLIYHSESIGQRAATNEGARLSTAKYVMKVDAHCAFDKGFDRKMIEEMHDDWTMVPIMKNLHAFDWVCENGHRRYQSPSGPCKECGKPTTRDVIWYAKPSPNSTSYRFDSTLHFQYWGEYAKRPEAQTPISDTMSLQGSCFMCTREKYFELNLCDETWGSWGNQGTEVACKTWLSGGRVVCNKKTWYAHMFRTQGGDFGFPYPQSGKQVEYAREKSREAFLRSNWSKAKYPLSWLIEKFAPVPDWEEIPETAKQPYKGPTKGIIYYTDNQLIEPLATKVREQLTNISKEKGIPIVSATLKRMDFGDKNIYFPSLKRGYLTMFKQILGALENSSSDIIFFCEHDVLYHPSHFDFTPSDKNKFYYNQNFWKLRMSDGHAIHFDANQLSGMCAYRELLIEEYRKIVNFIEKEGFTIKSVSFEPGTRDGRAMVWKSKDPIVDVRHDTNLTRNRWSQDEFRDKSTCQGWLETDDEIPGWGKTSDLVETLRV